MLSDVAEERTITSARSGSGSRESLGIDDSKKERQELDVEAAKFGKGEDDDEPEAKQALKQDER